MPPLFIAQHHTDYSLGVLQDTQKWYELEEELNRALDSIDSIDYVVVWDLHGRLDKFLQGISHSKRIVNSGSVFCVNAIIWLFH